MVISPSLFQPTDGERDMDNEARARAKSYVRMLLGTLRMHRIIVRLLECSYDDGGGISARWFFFCKNGRRIEFDLDGKVSVEHVSQSPQLGSNKFHIARSWRHFQLDERMWPKVAEAIFDAEPFKRDGT